MSTSLRPVITNEGITALIDAKNRGVKAKITHVAVGDGVAGDGDGPYIATNDMTALKHEIQRTIVAGGELLGNLQNQLHLTATIQDRGDSVPEVYPIYEIGFFLETGTLFAIYASPNEKLAEKVAGTDFVLAFDLTLTGADAGDVVIDGSGKLEMPIARDNLLMGENAVKIHTQAEFDRIFNQGEDTEITENTTIILNPIQNTIEDNFANGAWGGKGNEPHNTFNGRPAYILKNRVQINSNVSILGFNQEDTLVIKGNANVNIVIKGKNSTTFITGVKFCGWSFDGRGGAQGLGGDLEFDGNGGAIFIQHAKQCHLDCKIINHRSTKKGGGIFGSSAFEIWATQLHKNIAESGGGVFGCTQSILTVYDCQALAGGSGVFSSNDSEIRVFNCDAENCNNGISYRNNSVSSIYVKESLVTDRNAIFNGNVCIGTDSPEAPITLVAKSGNDPVGITQGSFGGSATMELTTRDSSGGQATRMCLRGGGDAANIEFLRGSRGSEAVSMFIEGDNGNVGVGTTRPKATLDVGGVVNAASGIRINGEKPFVYKRYKKLGDNVVKDTGKSASAYIATIAGFAARHGDIRENATGDIIRIFMFEKNGTWWIRADFHTHKNSETWDVDVLFINKLLVDVEE